MTTKDRDKTPNRPRQSAADDPRWIRILARDKTADGLFWYSVSTTGVYCRPSCPSRIANPLNVQIYDSLEGAQATGFRPCKRCKPDGASIEAENAALVAKACRIIEESEAEPSLEQLAEAVDRSPSYFHRVFKAITGLTPKDYAAGHRAKKIRRGLNAGRPITEAIYDAGFNSSGRFYEKSMGILGMTPSRYRAGGVNEEIRFAVAQTSLGAILVASSKRGVAVHRLPGNTPERDNVLGRGDLIVAIEVPARASHYFKLRDRQSYEFALVSAAVAVAVNGRRIRLARIAMGGVAHKPWRLTGTESALVGVSLDDTRALKTAIAVSFADARPLEHNAFKIELARRVALRALEMAETRV